MRFALVLFSILNWIRRHFKLAKASECDYVSSMSWEILPYEFKVDLYVTIKEESSSEPGIKS